MSSGQLVSAALQRSALPGSLHPEQCRWLGPVVASFYRVVSWAQPVRPFVASLSVIQALDSFGVSLLTLISVASFCICWPDRAPGPWETCFLSLLRILARSWLLALPHQVGSLHCPHIASGEPCKLSCPHDAPFEFQIPQDSSQRVAPFSLPLRTIHPNGPALLLACCFHGYSPVSLPLQRSSEFLHIGAGYRRVGGFSSLGFCCAGAQ